MRKRQAVILQKLLKEGGCTIRQLSLLCDVSYRTIQNDIRDINHLLHRKGSSAHLLTQSGIGVILKDADEAELGNLIRQLDGNNSGSMQKDPDLDQWMILFRLLQNDYIKVDDLCEELSLSRSVISRLLPSCRSILKKWNIRVRSKPHYGLYCEGAENDIRQLQFEHLVRVDEQEKEELLGTEAAVYFPLRENIVALIQKFDISINDSILEQLLLYVEIMTERILRGREVDIDLSVKHTSFEYILSEKICAQVAAFTEREIHSQEVCWVCRFIIGKCLQKKEEGSDVDHQLSERILKRAYALIDEKYHYDFSGDMELYASLSVHLRALLKRIQNDNYSINPMLGEIKMYSLLAYDMAVDVSLMMNELLHVQLPDDEISYFAIYLHLAIERQKQQIVPRRALVVCPSGKGMAELVCQYLKKQFGAYISELQTCGYYDLADMDFSAFDYIFTMSPLKQSVPLPVIEFSLNENSYYVKQTKMKLMGKGKERLPLVTFTPPSLFFSDLRAQTREDVLKQLVDRVGKQVVLDPGFYASVMQREAIVPTELEHGFAIPHPIDKHMAESSFFSVCVLNAPIQWQQRKVSIVLLTYIHGDSEQLESFYDSFARLIANREYAARLIERPSYETLLDIAERIYLENSV